MTKTFKCSYIDADCKWVAFANSEGEIMNKVKEHASKDHGITEISLDVLNKVKNSIKDQ